MKIKVYIGVIGSGKDYRAKEECTHTFAFADALREDVWKLLDWKPKTEDEYTEFKHLPLVYGDNGVITGRKILQNYGSLMKEVSGEDYWVKRGAAKLGNLLIDNSDCVIGVTDCRYDVEIEALIKLKPLYPNLTVEFIHCDYKSERYNAKDTHSSEGLAQIFAGRYHRPKQFNEIIYRLYGQ